jgi:TolA-binding protein
VLRADEAQELFTRGEALYQAAEWKGAAGSYAAVLARFPGSPYAAQSLYSRGWALFQAGSFEGALADFRAFQERYPTNALAAECQLKAGDSLRQLRRLDEAVRAYDPVCAAGGRLAPDAWAGKAWALYAQRDFDAAQAAFCAAAQACGRDARAAAYLSQAGHAGEAAQRAAVEQVRLDHAAGRYEAALARADACLVRHATGAALPQLRLARAEALLELKRLPEALQAYLQVGGADAAAAASASYGAAWVLLAQGKKDEARQRFEAFARQYPKHLLAPDASFRIGELAYEKEEFAAAATHYEIAAAAPAAFRDKALYKLGWAREKQAQREPAAQAFLRLAQQHPASEHAPEARYRAGCLLQAMGRLDEARAALAAAGDSVFAEKAACGVADCWRAAGSNTEAAVAYGQVLARWPRGECRLRALLGRADAQRAAGAFAGAAADYAEAAAAGETREAAQAMLGQGHCWLALKKWDDAARCFLKVDVLYGFDELKPEALALAARCRELAGDAAKAAACREELKKRFPASREAKGL